MGVCLCSSLTGALLALVYVIDSHIVRLFLPDRPRAIAIAEHINLVVGWSFVLFGIAFVLFGVVRANGAVVAPFVILFVSLLLTRVGFAKAFEPMLGQDAIWWSFPVGFGVCATLAIAHYRWGRWRNARMSPTTGAAMPH